MLIKTASFTKLGKDFFRVFIFVTTIEYTISGRIDYMGQRKKVIIIGGGFGGIFTARKLANHNIDVLLIDKQNHHLFQPLLYQVAAGILSPENVAIPLRLVFADNKYATQKILNKRLSAKANCYANNARTGKQRR